MAAVSPPRRRLRLPAKMGDQRVWRAAAVTGFVAGVLLLAYLLIPRDFYTGTNSVGGRIVASEIPSGQRLCIPDLWLPAGTGRIRLQGGAMRGVPSGLAVEAITPRQTLRASYPGKGLPPPPRIAFLDVPVRPLAEGTPMRLCVTAHGLGDAWVAGSGGMPTNAVAPRLDGQPIPNRVAVWFLP